MRFSIPGIIVGLVLVLGASLAARAADPQSYRVDIASTGNGAMDSTLRATSGLATLRKSAPVSPFGLIARARGEVDRLKTVLESYGYYQSAVNITIEGSALGSPGLADALTALPKGRDARVAITFTLGPLYHLRKVNLVGSVPQSVAGAFALKAGSPAVAADILAAGERLQSALQEQGYAFAKVAPPVADEDATLPVLDVSFTVSAGARVTIGDIRLKGLVRLHDSVVRRRLTVHTGQMYSPGAIEAARRDLLTLGPIASVSVDVGKAVDATGGVPITFVLSERKRHSVTLNAAYSSDLGGSGGVTWGDRNVFGNAEQLNVSASIINLGGSDTTGLGYDTSAKFLIPDFEHRDQSLQFTVGAIKQYLVAYDQKAVTGGVTLTRKLSSVWTVSAGLATTEEQIIQDSVTRDYTLVALPLTVSYDSTHLASPLDDPRHGMRDSLSITPTESLGHPNATFIISQIKLAAYVDFSDLGWGDPGRNIVAFRALAGLAQGAGEFSLPPDQRFYAGGSSTIRGYPYQQVGALFPYTTIPIGGTAIAAGTVEFRKRFAGNWGGAIFADAGQVSEKLQLLPSEVRVGVGIGVRYYTSIGPIRIDVAAPTKRDIYQEPNAITPAPSACVGKPAVTPGCFTTRGAAVDQTFQVYIGLGQAF